MPSILLGIEVNRCRKTNGFTLFGTSWVCQWLTFPIFECPNTDPPLFPFAFFYEPSYTMEAIEKPVVAIVPIASDQKDPSFSDAFETNASTGRPNFTTASTTEESASPGILVYPVAFLDFETFYLARFYDEERHLHLRIGSNTCGIVDERGKAIPSPSRYAHALKYIDSIVQERQNLIERLDEMLTKAGSPTVSRANECYLHSGVCMILADEARQNGDAHEYARWIARAALVGDRKAQAELVRLLTTGTGIAPDKPMAAFWQSGDHQNNATIRVPVIRDTQKFDKTGPILSNFTLVMLIDLKIVPQQLRLNGYRQDKSCRRSGLSPRQFAV